MPSARWTTPYLPGATPACCSGCARGLAPPAVQGWGAGLAPRGPRAQSLLAELKRKGRALRFAWLLTCWVTPGKFRPLSVPQLSQMSFGAQDMGLSPVQRGAGNKLISVYPDFWDGGCYRKARQEVLMEYEARISDILMFNPFPCTSALFCCALLGRAELVMFGPSGRGKGYEPWCCNAAGEHAIYQDPFEHSVLLQSLPWLHYTTTLPSCFGIPCTGHKRLEGNRARPHLSSQGLWGESQLCIPHSALRTSQMSFTTAQTSGHWVCGHTLPWQEGQQGEPVGPRANHFQ